MQPPIERWGQGSRIRLGRDESPNPTPASVRGARRRGDLLEFVAGGVRPDQVAARFGFRSGAAATRAVERARDRVYPFDHPSAILIETRLTDRVVDPLVRSIGPHLSDNLLTETTRLVIESVDLSLRHLAGREEVQRARSDPAWVDLQTADLGMWTPELQFRGEGRTFHQIAADLDLDDWFAAADLIATALVRYEQGCAVRVRARQIAVLDTELHHTIRQIARNRELNLTAARRALTILKHRLDVRGIGLPFPGPLIEHPPTVRRPRLPPPSWKQAALREGVTTPVTPPPPMMSSTTPRTRKARP